MASPRTRDRLVSREIGLALQGLGVDDVANSDSEDPSQKGTSAKSGSLSTVAAEAHHGEALSSGGEPTTEQWVDVVLPNGFRMTYKARFKENSPLLPSLAEIRPASASGRISPDARSPVHKSPVHRARTLKVTGQTGEGEAPARSDLVVVSGSTATPSSTSPGNRGPGACGSSVVTSPCGTRFQPNSPDGGAKANISIKDNMFLRGRNFMNPIKGAKKEAGNRYIGEDILDA